MEVGGWTDAPIAWPRRKKTGRRSLILTAELARAVRTESAAAICHWWGVGPTKVWQWRQALGVETTKGSQRIACRGVPADGAAKGRKRAAQPDARIRMAKTKRGKLVHPNTRAALLGPPNGRNRPPGAGVPTSGCKMQSTSMIDTPIARWRARIGLSQRAAAELLGVSLTSYQDAERGINRRTGKPARVADLWRLACAARESGIPPVE